MLSCVFQSRALNGVCEKTVQATSDPSKSEMSCLEEVHITNVKPGEGLVRLQDVHHHLHSDHISETSLSDKCRAL